jgi:hypothetical protein
MKRILYVALAALAGFSLAACNLFFEPKTVAYSVTHSVDPVAIDVAGAGEDGVVFTASAFTDWGHSFEVKYTDFPFEAFLAVTNKDSVDSVTMAVYLEGSQIAWETVGPGDTEMFSPSVGY